MDGYQLHALHVRDKVIMDHTHLPERPPVSWEDGLLVWSSLRGVETHGLYCTLLSDKRTAESHIL